MYYIYGISRSSLLIESTDSMIVYIFAVTDVLIYKRVGMFDLKIDQYRVSTATAKYKVGLKILYPFGIVLSVNIAASIIALLLMLSGDIEENPGPGEEHRYVQYYCAANNIIIIHYALYYWCRSRLQ